MNVRGVGEVKVVVKDSIRGCGGKGGGGGGGGEGGGGGGRGREREKQRMRCGRLKGTV